MSLQKLSERTGITVSTLSRLENGRIGAGFDRITQVAEGLGVSLPELFSVRAENYDTGAERSAGRRSVSRRLERNLARTAQYAYETLCWELKEQSLFPVILKPLCTSLEQFGPLVRHDGQEFIYVLRGRCRVVTEQYEDTLLLEGDGMYIDSTMGHAILNAAPSGETVVIGCATVKRPSS
jgi:transcriptional regulator with XRE-family HTH domain